MVSAMRMAVFAVLARTASGQQSASHPARHVLPSHSVKCAGALGRLSVKARLAKKVDYRASGCMCRRRPYRYHWSRT